MKFPKLSAQFQLNRLEPPKGRIRMVLDTDTYNEIDDQFALVYSLLSDEKLDVEAIYAAPFHNARSTGPADGMEKSYQEILRLLDRMNRSPKEFVFRGSTDYLPEAFRPCPSDAAEDLVKRAMACGTEPLYVAAIGAITNVASAVLVEPKIIEKIVIVWLGGHAPYWPHTREFNLEQDVPAARLLFDCGVPLIQIPCLPVASHLLTTAPDMEYYYPEMGEVGKYLVDSFKGYTDDPFAWAKEIWDISVIAYLVNPEWVPTDLIHSPVLTDQVTWSHDPSRHFIRAARQIHRNAVFRDMLLKLCRQ